MYLLESYIKRFSKASHVELVNIETKELFVTWFDIELKFEEQRRLMFGECLEKFNSFVEDITTYYKNSNLRGTRVFCFKDARFVVNITIYWVEND
jgi:hypothetical protein